MSNVRRVNDRRRRVLYTAHQTDQYATTGATRSEVRRLREARRPQEAYGSRVHRRLRGRWFSLVPVRRRSMAAVSAGLLITASLICVAHYLAVTWPAIAYRPEIARPLRLDRPDGFGHYMMLALLTVSTGISLLIYQLRRYRNDDFKGRYRLWRLVIVVLGIASINSMVGMIDWGGAILDALFGKRVALTGSDWIRLVVSLGGAVLAIRMIAEVRRSRSSLLLMLATGGLFMIPEAAKWNVLSVDSLWRWLLVTSAPLLACTTLSLSLVSYLRMLYREVRQIVDGDTAWERFRLWQSRLLETARRKPDPEDNDSSPEKTTKDSSGDEERDKSRWWKRKRKEKNDSSTLRVRRQPEVVADDSADEEEDSSESIRETKQRNAADKQTSPSKQKRRWFGLRRRQGDPQESNADGAKDVSADRKPSRNQDPSPSREPAPKRSRFSLRLRPPRSDAKNDDAKNDASQNSEGNQGDTADQNSGAADSQDRPKRGWRLGWFGRGKNEQTANGESKKASKPARPQRNNDPEDAQGEDDEFDGSDIDWNSLSKAERRRLRKQLKRQNRAA